MLESLLNIRQETQGQMFPCKYFEVFKNIYFEEYLRVTASVSLDTHSKLNIHKMLIRIPGRVNNRLLNITFRLCVHYVWV